jgi:RNA polymerase sigma-70 factor (ECF subfamily)
VAHVWENTVVKPEQSSTTEASDGSLVRRFRHGSEDAATQLYLRYARRLRALARARCPRNLAVRVDADDIVQSVFRSFFQAARRGLYEVPRGEELWKILLVIALNKIRDATSFHQAARRDVRLTAQAEHNQAALAEKQQDDASLVFLQLVIDEALERLPPPHRRMVRMRIEGHEVAQIALATGRSKRSVERILQEARQKLHEAFHESI